MSLQDWVWLATFLGVPFLIVGLCVAGAVVLERVDARRGLRRCAGCPVRGTGSPTRAAEATGGTGWHLLTPEPERPSDRHTGPLKGNLEWPEPTAVPPSWPWTGGDR